MEKCCIVILFICAKNARFAYGSTFNIRNQGPFLQLCLIKGPSNKDTLKGKLEVLLVNCNADYEHFTLISDKNCVVTTSKKIISEAQLPVNAQVNKFLRDSGVSMWVSFKPRSENSELFIGLTVIVLIAVVYYLICLLLY